MNIIKYSQDLSKEIEEYSKTSFNISEGERNFVNYSRKIELVIVRAEFRDELKKVLQDSLNDIKIDYPFMASESVERDEIKDSLIRLNNLLNEIIEQIELED